MFAAYPFFFASHHRSCGLQGLRLAKSWRCGCTLFVQNLRGRCANEARIGILYAVHPALAFSCLKNRKISSKLSFKQRTMLEDGYLLEDYVWDGILHTVELNQYLCDSEVVVERVDGEKKYYSSKEFFATKMKEQFL